MEQSVIFFMNPFAYFLAFHSVFGHQEGLFALPDSNAVRPP